MPQERQQAGLLPAPTSCHPSASPPRLSLSCPTLRRARRLPRLLPPSAPPQAKEGFYAMLDECKELEVTAGHRPKFSRARDLLELDARWQVGAGWKLGGSRVGAGWKLGQG